MESTISKAEELKAFGYRELGIYVKGSEAFNQLLLNRSAYTSMLYKQLDTEGNIVNIFVK